MGVFLLICFVLLVFYLINRASKSAPPESSERPNPSEQTQAPGPYVASDTDIQDGEAFEALSRLEGRLGSVQQELAGMQSDLALVRAELESMKAAFAPAAAAAPDSPITREVPAAEAPAEEFAFNHAERAAAFSASAPQHILSANDMTEVEKRTSDALDQQGNAVEALALDDLTTQEQDDAPAFGQAAETPEEETPAWTKTPVPPVEQEGFLESVWKTLGTLGLTRFINAGNLWVLAGVVVLLVGVVFLINYAMQFITFNPQARLASASLVGIALLAVGWRQRNSRPELGLILQGGGVGALYLTIVAGVQLYPVLPKPLAFCLLVALVVFSTFLAIVQNAKIMAHVAKGAGFLAPLLVSSGTNNYVALFSYYILLNLGIIAVSRYRNWRSLHLNGFICTMGIAGIWGATRYTADYFAAPFPSFAHFWSVEPFLMAFFAIFSWLAIFGNKAGTFTVKDKREAAIDVPLTVGTPLLVFLYQAFLCRGLPFVLAFTALALGLFYLLAARYLWAKRAAPAQDDDTATALYTGKTLQAQIFLAFGVMFANLALPLAFFDIGLEHWTERLLSLIWCVEGAALIWMGRKTGMRLLSGFGLLGFALGIGYIFAYAANGAPEYFRSMPMDAGGVIPYRVVLDAPGMLATSALFHLFAVVSFITAAYAVRSCPALEAAKERDTHGSRVLLGVGLAWLYGFSLFELYSFPYRPEAMLVLCVLAGLAATRLAARLSWKELTLVPYASYAPLLWLVLPMALELALVLFGKGIEFFGRHFVSGGLVLAFAFFEIFRLRSADKRSAVFWGNTRFALALNLVLLAAMVLGLKSVSLLVTLPYTWTRLLVMALPALFVWLLATRGDLPRRFGLPVWLTMSALPLTCLGIWFVADIFQAGNAAPLFFLPVLNPLEMGLGLALVAFYLWVAQCRRYLPGHAIVAIATLPEVWMGIVFLMLNLCIARTTAQWSEVPFTLWAIMPNASFQAAISILWGATGFSAMLYGHKKLSRPMWIAGVLLVLIDLLKLFLVDLTRIETLWRVVAFMLVGVMLIVIGNFMPLPPVKPKTDEHEEDKETV